MVSRVVPRRPARRLLTAVAGALIAVAASYPAAASAAPVQARASACSQEVAFGLIDATTSGCLNEVSTSEWQTKDTVTLNGVPVTPVGGTTLAPTGPSTSLPGGRISVHMLDIAIGGVTVRPREDRLAIFPRATRETRRPLSRRGLSTGRSVGSQSPAPRRSGSGGTRPTTCGISSCSGTCRCRASSRTAPSRARAG